ncbi:MAG: hypothetical protein ABIH22_00375 [Candidatus Margulisiibacteriota bacterium]
MKIKSLIIFLAVSVLLTSCAPANKFANVKNLHTATGKTLVCFGNSLTSGQGAPAGANYSFGSFASGDGLGAVITSIFRISSLYLGSSFLGAGPPRADADWANAKTNVKYPMTNVK